MFRSFFFVVVLLSSTPVAAAEPIRVILVGDSTVSSRTGYGDTLCKRLTQDVICDNEAKGGRSSKSYRTEGHWDRILADLDNKPYLKTFVLIQFGHNDEPGKPGRSTDLQTEFPANMAQYVYDVRAHGAIPVLVTPLSRRYFKNFKLRTDLAPWAAATRQVATKTRTPLVDLYADSVVALSSMGAARADQLAQAPAPRSVLEGEISGTSVIAPKEKTLVLIDGHRPPTFDYTHLGPKGARLFSEIVLRDLVDSVPSIAGYVR